MKIFLGQDYIIRYMAFLLEYMKRLKTKKPTGFTSGTSHVSVWTLEGPPPVSLGMENSTFFLAGSSPTANCGCPRVSVILMRCHRRDVPSALRLRKVITKLNCSGRPWLTARLRGKQGHDWG